MLAIGPDAAIVAGWQIPEPVDKQDQVGHLQQIASQPRHVIAVQFPSPSFAPFASHSWCPHSGQYCTALRSVLHTGQ